MSSNLIKSARPALKEVKTVLSTSHDEARKRVLNLYKLWYREVPYVVLNFDVPITVKQGRDKVKELFMKNQNLNDLRTIDLLVVRGQMELVETAEIWKQRGHIMDYFKQSLNEKPKDFLSRFLNSKQ